MRGQNHQNTRAPLFVLILHRAAHHKPPSPHRGRGAGGEGAKPPKHPLPPAIRIRVLRLAQSSRRAVANRNGLNTSSQSRAAIQASSSAPPQCSAFPLAAAREANTVQTASTACTLMRPATTPSTSPLLTVLQSNRESDSATQSTAGFPPAITPYQNSLPPSATTRTGLQTLSVTDFHCSATTSRRTPTATAIPSKHPTAAGNCSTTNT